MTRKRRSRRHVPQRTCVACRVVRSKRELIRVVRTPEGEVLVDERGKRNGRGAYLCAQRVCWEEALAGRRLDKALKTELGEDTVTVLRDYAVALPGTLGEAGETEPEGAS
ncbi:MAG: YlxR family protein [Anaerolineae bacterium]|jgi:predicted RNA-binding protein YlxR (DUF448 family)